VTTILVVDDEPDLEALILQRFRRQIREGAVAFLFARDGAEALDTVARHPAIGLVLADINMPRMDGLTLLGRLQEADHPLATVVVSAYGDMESIRTAMNRGAFDFLTKPIDFADLEATVAKTLRHVAALREARAAAAELQRQREALLQAEKMAAFGSLLAGVAHELNNPLSIVLGGALMLQEAAEQAAPSLVEDAERVRIAAERCARIVRSFLAMARQQAAERRPADAAALTDDVLELLAYGPRSNGVEVVRDMPADLPALFGDADQLHQVMANLVTNARQALEQRPEPWRLRIAARAEGALVGISIADNGPASPRRSRGGSSTPSSRPSRWARAPASASPSPAV
jgi:C4-dicarboxylate-specific signal transduction histidine kinase